MIALYCLEGCVPFLKGINILTVTAYFGLQFINWKAIILLFFSFLLGFGMLD